MSGIDVTAFSPTLPNFAFAKWAQVAFCNFGLRSKRVDVEVLA